MLKRSIILLPVLMSMLLNPSTSLRAEGVATATANTTATASSSANAVDDIIERNNQMMVLFAERMRTGNYKEARDIANEMVAFAKKYTENSNTEYKCFYSELEKDFYILRNKDSKKKIEWVQDPIADGYYFLAVLDFQEHKYKEALENMTKCIYWNPMHSAYYNERGFMLLNAGEASNILSSQIAYEKAIELAMDSSALASALRGIGFVMTARENFKVAIAALTISKDLEPDNISTEEAILYIKGVVENFNMDMTLEEAVKTLKENKIQFSFTEDIVKLSQGLNDGN